MTSILLIYPHFRGSIDRSRFRFPPLGVAYLAASLREAGHRVHLLDCSFSRRDDALQRALAIHADIVGISCLATMQDDCLRLAERLRDHCGLLVAGGPLPTCHPEAFLQHFDVVVRGEGEQTMPEIVAAYEAGTDLRGVRGAVFPAATGAEGSAHEAWSAPPRPLSKDLDGIAFPARDLLPNARYIAFGRKAYGLAVTTIMSTRGCPYRCEFCSNVVFGASYRERSPCNVVDEIEEALSIGYDHISFADDVFTLNRSRVLEICAEIERRGLVFSWECLGRVDSFDRRMALAMRRSGCRRVFFGIESGDDEVLRLMRKQITTAQARRAVDVAHRAGLEVGAFFIVCYPGETDETVLATLRFATSLPLDYIGLTMPYPLPGTDLRTRISERSLREWRPRSSPLMNQVLTYDGDFSALKMRFAIVKGRAQFAMKRRLGRLAPLALACFERPTDAVFRRLR